MTPENTKTKGSTKAMKATEFTIQESLGFLYIACAGADGQLAKEEVETLIKSLNEWSETGVLVSSKRMVELINIWKGMSRDDEIQLVMDLAGRLKQQMSPENLLAIFKDLHKIANAKDGLNDQEKDFLGFIVVTWGLQ
jgi:uncharacterized tellurite resistance protein B-like protein